jgi:hypothetical protein
MRKICVSLAGLALTLVGCSADNPNACRPNDDKHKCSGGMVCDPNTFTCQRIDAGTDGPIVDTRVADVPMNNDADVRDLGPDKPADVAADHRVPDAAGTCGAVGECSGATPFCDVTAKVCVECLIHNDCRSTGKPLCIGNTCAACTTASADAGATDAGAGPTCKDKDSSKPACNPDNGSCVACTTDSQCGGTTPLCVNNKCVSCTSGTDKITCANKDAKQPLCGPSGACVECTASGQCNGTTPLCAKNKCVKCGDATGDVTCANKSSSAPACATSGACVECTGSGNCKTQDKPACNTTKNVCVECTQNSDCGDKAPVCDQTTNTCKGCSTDAQCTGRGSGVCMAHVDGRCASVAETIYVQKSGCSANGTGTTTDPFCNAQQAIDALTATRRLIVVRGTVDGFAWGGSGKQVTVVGQSNAMLAGGSNPAISVSGGDLYVRDLTATLSAAPAVSATLGAVLRLNHVKVTNCPGGGILIDNAGFELTDVLVSGNGPGTFGVANWGGILINNPASSPKKLDRVSATDNKPVGISCSASVSGSGVLATGNTGGVDISPTCSINSCSPASSTCGSSLTL